MRRNVLIIMVIALAGVVWGQWTGATPKGDFSELQIGGTTVITSGRVLQNATANASVITAGTLSTDRYSAAADLAAELTPSVDQTVKWSGTAWVATGFPAAGNYGNTITVAKSGGDYTTIQAAVDAATTGTTVLVYPGTYEEQVTINKKIQIEGINKDTCIVSKDITITEPATYGDGVVNWADDGSISNITIINGGSSPNATIALYLGGGTKNINNCNVSVVGRDAVTCGGGVNYFNGCNIESTNGGHCVWIYNGTNTFANSTLTVPSSATTVQFTTITYPKIGKFINCIMEGNYLFDCDNGNNTLIVDNISSYGGANLIESNNATFVLGIMRGITGLDSDDSPNIRIGKAVAQSLDVSGTITGTFNGVANLDDGTGFGEGLTLSEFAFYGYDDNDCVWNSGDDVTIPLWTFGGDTTLYRGGANILKTDDAFDANSLKIGGTEVINSSGNSVLNATPATAGVSGEVVTLTAGENLTFGDVCYAKSDGKYWKAKGDAAGTMPAVVMAAGTISASAAGSFLLRGYARNDSWSALTIGGQVWVSAATGGAFTQTQPSGSGNLVQNVGYATAAKVIYFDPERTIITLP